jgi:hypothetical protein
MLGTVFLLLLFVGCMDFGNGLSVNTHAIIYG